MAPLKKWILATRPWSFPASTMPVLIAISYTFFHHHNDISAIHLGMGLLAIVGVVLFHAAGNLISDFFDYRHGVDSFNNIGNTNMMIINGIFKPKTILWYGCVCFVAGTFIGLVSVLYSGVALLIIGLLGALLTFFYYKLKYNALGDLTIFVIFGLLIALGTEFMLTKTLDYTILLISTPTGLLVTAILHANNARDIVNDTQANIVTQASVLGFRNSQRYHVILLSSAYIMILLLIITGLLPWLAFSVFVSLPMAIKNIKSMLACKQPMDIQNLDGQTAQLVLIFSLLLAVSTFIAPCIA